MSVKEHGFYSSFVLLHIIKNIILSKYMKAKNRYKAKDEKCLDLNYSNNYY